jgi:hypothetical protein
MIASTTYFVRTEESPGFQGCCCPPTETTTNDNSTSMSMVVDNKSVIPVRYSRLTTFIEILGRRSWSLSDIVVKGHSLAARHFTNWKTTVPVLQSATLAVVTKYLFHSPRLRRLPYTLEALYYSAEI